MQRLSETGCHAGTGPFNDRCKLPQSRPAGTFPELRCGLQAQHFRSELLIGPGCFGGSKRDLDCFTDGALPGSHPGLGDRVLVLEVSPAGMAQLFECPE